MLYFEKVSLESGFSPEEIKQGVSEALNKLGEKKKVLALPPDFTRFHSYAGQITNIVYHHYKDALTDVLPAQGTHFAMTDAEITKMFGDIPKEKFRVHNWRDDVVTVGNVPAEFVSKISDNAVNYEWPAQVNKLLIEGNYDLILSVGQVVPHEVIGMANYNKNIFVGTGGAEGINKSHFLGAAYGMERIMGRADNPVRQIMNYASDNFTNNLPIVYIQTVVARNTEGKLKVKGMFIGDDIECFNKAAGLSLQLNFEMLEKPLKKIIVYLDPAEFKSTWLGNKSVYRTRMAINNGGELIVLAPGLKEFGEDPQIDKLIRKYGYVGTPGVLKAVEDNEDLRNNLSAAAHLIHGSSEGRFSITYCPGNLTKKEIESVNFEYSDLEEMTRKYNPGKLKDGYNTMPDGEEIFFISNPAIGLWAYKERFN